MFELQDLGGGALRAQGPLTFASARAARAAGLAALACGPSSLRVDLKDVAPADSAGLAVLLDLLGQARQNGAHLTFANIPAGLAALARISEIEELLERGV